MSKPSITLHAYAADVCPGVTLHATMDLWDHEGGSDLVETARRAFQAAMATVWATPATQVRVYTQAENETF